MFSKRSREGTQVGSLARIVRIWRARPSRFLPRTRSLRGLRNKCVEDAQARRLSEKRSAGVEGYEYQRGQFGTFTADALKALEFESSNVIDLEKFVTCGTI